MDRRTSRRRARAALARVVRSCTDVYRPLAENLEDRTLLSVNSSFAAGALVLIGDPGRAWLPRRRLQELARYPVADFGEPLGDGAGTSSVFRLTTAGVRRGPP